MRFVDPGNRGDMRNHIVFGHLQVIQYGTGGGNTAVHMFDTETFQRIDFEMFLQAFAGCVPVEKPFFDGIDIEFITEKFMKTGFLPPGIDDFFRLKTIQ